MTVEKPKRYHWVVTALSPIKVTPQGKTYEEYVAHGQGTNIHSIMAKARIFFTAKYKLKDSGEVVITKVERIDHLEF